MEDDPLLTAVAVALREHGVDDPRTVLAAADAAVRVLGRDRCVCKRAVHAEHHLTPVARCPWCAPDAAPVPRARQTVTVPTSGLL
jgi:uncharacterized Fe-S cluster protein YjdI